MSDSAQAQQLYKSGMDLYAAKRFEEALSAFNRAISLGDRGWKTLDAKAATMNRLGGAWRQSAFEIASSLCKKYGDKSHRPWYRVASILLSLGMADAAERSISKGLPLAKDSASRKVLLDLRGQVRAMRERVAAERVVSAEQAEAERAAKAKAAMCFTHLLSADVLFLVAGAGVGTDPGIGIRMAGVCREWRETMLASHTAWSHLVLGRKRPRAKAILWAQRSRGRITRLTVNTPPGPEHEDIIETLRPCVGNVQHFKVRYSDVVSDYLAWKGLMRVKSLRFVGRRIEWLAEDLRLLAPKATVESIDYSGPDSGTYWSSHIGQPYISIDEDGVRLASLKVFRASQGVIRDRLWLTNLARVAPKLSEVAVTCLTMGDLDTEHEPFAAECLTRLELPDTAGIPSPFETMSVPALTHLCCGSLGNLPLRQLRAPGLPRQHLVSIDIGNHPIDQGDLLNLLPELECLRFLNVSFCPDLNNDFLEALVAGEQTLLPNLTALSIAGNDHISAGPLRRMILSRLPDAKPRSQKAPPPPKRSAFAPARASPAASPAVVTTPPSSARPQVAPFKWLNVDLCNNANMDVTVLAALRQKLSFLSNLNSRNPERIHGRGMFAWDADDDCTPDQLGDGCGLRKRRADDEGWYVHHTCKKQK